MHLKIFAKQLIENGCTIFNIFILKIFLNFNLQDGLILFECVNQFRKDNSLGHLSFYIEIPWIKCRNRDCHILRAGCKEQCFQLSVSMQVSIEEQNCFCNFDITSYLRKYLYNLLEVVSAFYAFKYNLYQFNPIDCVLLNELLNNLLGFILNLLLVHYCHEILNCKISASYQW